VGEVVSGSTDAVTQIEIRARGFDFQLPSGGRRLMFDFADDEIKVIEELSRFINNAAGHSVVHSAGGSQSTKELFRKFDHAPVPSKSRTLKLRQNTNQKAPD
jgi:hypothetical protein